MRLSYYIPLLFCNLHYCIFLVEPHALQEIPFSFPVSLLAFLHKVHFYHYPNELEQVLSLDPRPAYQNDAERIYKMKFADFDISFRVDLDGITVIEIVELSA